MWVLYPLFYLYIFSIIPLQNCIARDCLAEHERLSYADNTTLISPGSVFEFGFFAPEGNSEKCRYLGIWYYGSNPKIVVWVANREKPLSEPTGFLSVNDLIGTESSIPKSNRSYSRRLCLGDNGNLVLGDQGLNMTLWQSFDHPTDTLLPGMMSFRRGRNLTSWNSSSNPAPGVFTLLPKPGAEKELLISAAGRPLYWDSEVTSSDKMPSALSELIHDRGGKRYKYSRLVMNFTGQAQFWTSESGKLWSLMWWEPKNRCSLRNSCGSFGSCNSNNKLPCKCLPGYKPSLLEEWNTGCFSGGCLPKSGSPCSRRDYLSDKFLRLPVMKVGTPSDSESNEEDCESKCCQECNCVAYSCGTSANCSLKDTSTENKCLMWSSVLTGLQEEYSNGLTVFVRTALSDIEPTPRSCNPCGAYIIPYPLSTGPNCGDSSYRNFYCNASTGQLNFSASNGTFKVNVIDPDEKAFSIQVPHAKSCHSGYIESLILSPESSLPFDVIDCTIVEDQYTVEVEEPFIEVKIEWKPPTEPACNASSDCLGWHHTTCKAGKDGKKRCICGSKFSWDGQKLACMRDNARILFKVLVSSIAGLVVLILCAAMVIHYIQKRRITQRQRCAVSKEEDGSEGIDVPFFTWENIVDATDNFAAANKLGAGGFGAVYKGKLPDGKEIAVKRLSNVSIQGVEEFRTEVVLIAKLQHRNLVRLLGYCVKAQEKILVYEYMRNGSLDSCLCDNQTGSIFLDWRKRLDIILGIARGLLYLHQDSRLRIIHRDLKPSNVLLDDELNPKISDFGTAKIVGGKETEASTNRVVGTCGYMAPEYAYEGLFSVKSDVFSFGVVVLESVSGRRNSRSSQIKHGISLLEHAWRLWSEDRALDLLDQNLQESCNQTEVLKCIHIGLLCVQGVHLYRPTMSTVLLMLSTENPSLPLPKEPAFITSGQSSETALSSNLSDLGSNKTFSPIRPSGVAF